MGRVVRTRTRRRRTLLNFRHHPVPHGVVGLQLEQAAFPRGVIVRVCCFKRELGFAYSDIMMRSHARTQQCRNTSFEIIDGAGPD